MDRQGGRNLLGSVMTGTEEGKCAKETGLLNKKAMVITRENRAISAWLNCISHTKPSLLLSMYYTACLKHTHLYNTNQHRNLPHHSELDQDLGHWISCGPEVGIVLNYLSDYT